MARPALPPEQKKVPAPLDFTPIFLAAMDALREGKSRSTYVEEWMREKPEIAAWLAEHGDTGMKPPSRMEQVMDALLAFYRPNIFKNGDILKVIRIARDAITRHPQGTEEEIVQAIVGAMAMLWTHDDYWQSRAVCSFEEMPGRAREYASRFYQLLFLEYCEGERALLTSRFRSIVTTCKTIARTRYKEEKDKEEEQSN